MKQFLNRRTLTTIFILTLLLLSGNNTTADAPPTPTPVSQEFTLIEAPAPPTPPLPPSVSAASYYSKGFIPPPIDLSHLTGQTMPGGARIQSLPASFDWRNTGKITSVKDQSTCGSCYAFAALGNIEAKMLIDDAGTYDFSENNAKECNWYDASCGGGNYMKVANLLSKKGTVLEADDPYVASDVSCNASVTYQKTLLDWRYISDGVPDTNVLKQYIYDHGPVYTSMYAGYYDAWEAEFGNYDGSYTLYYAGSESTNHAVLIVGWDDTLPHDGGNGGWIVKNSWGADWGDSGYFTIAYGSASIGSYSSFMYAWQDYDSDGDLWYYDEGGWENAYGCNPPTTTAWRLARFTPDSNTYVTRVEFWTNDRTTDIDVYLYDSFDGSSLSNLLAQKEDNSFYESGYHSVAFSSPVEVSNGDDVFAVVKVTNNSYNYPIVVDTEGPSETGRTYASCDGSSWTDMGTSFGADVGLRLRVSSSGGVNQPPTISGLPDRDLLKNTSRDNAIDLWEYAADDEDADSNLAFSIRNSPVVSAGVSIDSNHYVDINPATDWTGVTNVEIQVQDTGGLTDTDTFSVTVSDSIANQPPTLSDLPNQTLSMNSSLDNAIDLWAYAEDAYDPDPDLAFSISNSPSSGAGVSLDSDRYLDINPDTNWTGETDVVIQVQDTGGLTDTDVISVTVSGATVYLPLVTRCWPQVPYLHPISNSNNDGIYTVEWSWPDCASAQPSYYQVQGDSDSQFGSPDSFTEYDTNFDAYSPTPATYYWRARAYVSGQGWSDWSNVQTTQVTSWRAYVWVDNDTGGNLTVEIVGVSKKNFSSGYHYWRSISPGRYTYKAWAWCGSGTWTDDFDAGENELSFWCSTSASKELLGTRAFHESQTIQDFSSMR